jgi:hypothetical protein
MLKWHEVYTHKLVATWMGILGTFLFMSVSWMPADTMTDFSCSFQKYNRNSGPRFWVRLLKFGTDYNVCTHTHPRELMKSVWEEWQVVIGIRDKVMVWYFLGTLISSWPHSVLSFLFWVCWNWHNGYLKMFLLSFICNLIDICQLNKKINLFYVCHTSNGNMPKMQPTQTSHLFCQQNFPRLVCEFLDAE